MASDIKSALAEFRRALREVMSDMHDTFGDKPAARSFLARLDDLNRLVGEDDFTSVGAAQQSKNAASFEA